MLRTGRHQPGVTGFEHDGLPLDNQLSLSRQDVADRLVVPSCRGLLLRLLVSPQPQRNPLSRNQIGLIHFAMRRGLTADLFHGGIDGHEITYVFGGSWVETSSAFMSITSPSRRNIGATPPTAVGGGKLAVAEVPLHRNIGLKAETEHDVTRAI